MNVVPHQSACELVPDRVVEVRSGSLEKYTSVLVTGGAGFIGSNFVREWIRSGGHAVILDLLTYAGNSANLSSLSGNSRHRFVHGDICDSSLVRDLLRNHRPQAIIHFAAESHVDRSIVDPGAFIQTNVQGTYTILEEARKYWSRLSKRDGRKFRFFHVSTDEVYGALEPQDAAFSEAAPYAPTSPYAASKAASDHLVRAYFHTYGLPTLTTNCSNNYGPFQFPEKLIPLMILNALEGRPMPLYGDGQNMRDWLFVGDHCSALRAVLENGCPGETYNVGGNSQKTNLEVVHQICRLTDELKPHPFLDDRRQLIRFVPDRLGHDRRYALDTSKIARELGWRPAVTFADGLRRTVFWYLRNTHWIDSVRTGAHTNWIRQNYEQRAAK